VGNISKDLLITGLQKLLTHFCENGKPIYNYRKIKDILGLSDPEFNTFSAQIETLGLTTKSSTFSDVCSTCGRRADVIDAQRGICKCEYGHKTIRDPYTLVQAKIEEKRLVEFLHKRLAEAIPSMNEPDARECSHYFSCGYEILGGLHIDDLQALLLLAFKKLDLKDACTLQGLLNNSSEDLFLTFVPGVDQEAKELLAYKANGAIHLLPLSLLFSSSKNVLDELDNLSKGVTGQAIRLSSWLRSKLQGVPSLVSPEIFRKIIEYDSKLVDDSFKAATHGRRDEFEDIASNLFSSFIPTTQLGHKNSPGTGKIEKPDGVVLIESKSDLRLMFYDCKSAGTEERSCDVKNITQSDEDEFARYSEMFSQSRMPAKLIGGCFVANDFSETNIMNKTVQLRKRVPNEVRIVFLPLRSLVKLYSRVTTERQSFSMRFVPSDHFEKLLGINLNKGENKELERDDAFGTYSKIKSLDANAVYIIPALVDVFLNEVFKSAPLEDAYLPFVIEKSKRLSARA
jgi:hypothetical protein